MVFAPAAMASSGPVQVTGKQLKSALLPGSDFLAGYKAAAEDDSGRKLEHITVFKLSSMSCKDFWLFIGSWRIVRKLRCCPGRAGQLAKAIHVLPTRETGGGEYSA
jgi:hypothetical protein